MEASEITPGVLFGWFMMFSYAYAGYLYLKNLWWGLSFADGNALVMIVRLAGAFMVPLGIIMGFVKPKGIQEAVQDLAQPTANQ